MFNGFQSLYELINNFDVYREKHPEYYNEWLEKLIESYEKNKNLSDKQIGVLYSIAKKIGLKPGWDDQQKRI